MLCLRHRPLCPSVSLGEPKLVAKGHRHSIDSGELRPPSPSMKPAVHCGGRDAAGFADVSVGLAGVLNHGPDLVDDRVFVTEHVGLVGFQVATNLLSHSPSPFW